MCQFPQTIRIILMLAVLSLSPLTVSGDTILVSGDDNISEMNQSTGIFSAGTGTFSVTAAEIPNVELLADFFVVDAGVRVEVNGTPLFPDFFDISNFGPVPVFTNTGEPNGGGVNFPFSANNNGPNGSMLPRLSVNSTSAGTIFSGATFPSDTTITTYTPVFAVEDFNSLLVSGNNTIEFFVLNNFQGSNLQGEFEVILRMDAVPEPAIASVLLAGLLMLGRRRQR